jgi:hypothetical protein
VKLIAHFRLNAEVMNTLSCIFTPQYAFTTTLPSPGSVSIAIRLRNGRPRFYSRRKRGRDFFLSITASRPALGPIQPPVRWVPDAPSPGVKRPGHEASSAGVNV